jgi:hypothetical protein
MSSDDRGQRAQRAVEAIRPVRQDQRYDVVLSFAGEDREVARRLAHIAESNGVRVFLDEFHLWETWGKDLTEYLDGVYGGNARYCVLLVSADYLRKPYTVLERRIALARALESTEEYVLPVVLDDSWPPGLPRTTAYLDLRTMSIDDVAALLVRKIRGDNSEVRQDQRWRCCVAPTCCTLERDSTCDQIAKATSSNTTGSRRVIGSSAASS